MRKNRCLRGLSTILSGLVLTASFLGCSNKEESTQGKNLPESINVGQGDNIYPMKGDVTLKYWVSLHSSVSKTATSLGETPFAKELEKETGIKVQYVHPPQGQASESFNIMIASGDLPDIIEYGWYTFPGGPEKAIEDGIIIKLNDALSKYAPNLSKYYKENSKVDKMSKTDKGNYFMFPHIASDKKLTTVYGAIMRNDWLKELNMQVPTTIAEWYEVLKAFKEKKGAEAPLTFSLNDDDFSTGHLSGGFGVKNGFYLENDKTVYGPLQSEFKEFLGTMRKWYSEGLIDKNVSVIDSKTIDSKFLSGKAGATFGYAGGTIGRYLSAVNDSKFDIIAVPHTAEKKGEVPKFGHVDTGVINAGAAITTKCKNIEAAARLLDYGYSEKGNLLFNFGIEGESYKIVNGKPTYTELITKNPDKLSVAEAMGRYIRSVYSGPNIKDVGYMEQYMTYSQQKAAINTWSNSKSLEYLIPKISFTSEESEEVAKITNTLNTLNKEMIVKFILGNESIENYSKYVDQINKLGIDKVLKAYDNAIKRYNSR